MKNTAKILITFLIFGLFVTVSIASEKGSMYYKDEKGSMMGELDEMDENTDLMETEMDSMSGDIDEMVMEDVESVSDDAESMMKEADLMEPPKMPAKPKMVGKPQTLTGAQGTAKAIISGTEDGSDISGEVVIMEVNGGIKVLAQLKNVPGPGEHGFHIHENGSCADGGKAAGGHYNPRGVRHGLWEKHGKDNAHVGDMGNILIEEDGSGLFETFLHGVTIKGGQFNVANRSVILHANRDDFGQPTGNAGPRIGCGIIEVMM